MHLFDLLLLSVIVVTAYFGPMVLRRLGPGQRLYGWMLLGDLALAIVALASRRSDGPNATADLIGTVAIGAAVCLVLAPPLLRSLARRALVADRLPLARALVNLREHLQPGMGARQEAELISTILEVRSGQVDAAIDRLRERRARIDEPAVRRPIDERIVMTYLYARRWEDAIAWFEQHIGLDASSPQLAVELVRAYCELGQLDKAAVLVERLERHRASARAAAGGEAEVHAAEESIWHILVSRARLVFLAFVGRTEAVEAILAPRGPLGSMPESARHFWVGLVRLKAGDRTGARTSLERAAALSGRDGRARELAEATLRRIDEPGVAGPPEVSPLVAELADRLSRLAEDAPAASGERAGSGGEPARPPRARPPRLQGVSWREVPVTTGLLLANLAATALVYLLLGSSGDLGALAQAGALVKSAAAGGEPWRLVTAMFLHVGLLHLGLNMYGLWVLGRLVEQFLGSARMFVVYMAAGLVGWVASLYFGGPATSAGASGAVFGLLGAAAAELALHRKAYPRRWSGTLLGNLLFLAVANVVIGFMYPIIDQSAHIGGLLAGALLGAALSRKNRVAGARWMRALVAALCLAGAGALGYGAVGVATADYGETLASAPRRQVVLGGVAVEAPAHWQVVSENELFDPGLVVVVFLDHVGEGEGEVAPEQVLAIIEEQREVERTREAKAFGFTEARQADQPLLPVPPPWQVRELVAAVEGGAGSGGQVHRIAVVGRPAPGGGLWLGVIIYPASLADELAPTLGEMLSSARPAGGAAAGSAPAR